MTTLFLVLQVVFAVIITICVLLQKSSSIGLGAYSGSNESLFGAKGPAGFLAKFTAFMGILFVANTLALAYFYQQDAKSSVIDRVKVEQKAQEPDKNAVPAVPSAPSRESLNLKPAFDSAKDTLNEQGEKIEQAVQGAKKAIENNATSAVQGAKEAIENLENNASLVGDKAKDLAKAIEANATLAIDKLTDTNSSN